MSEGIAYQNKDILFKILGQTYKEKSFAAYGIDLPPIKELLPTSLPKISANEKDIDNLFLLEDGTYAIVDYESEFKKLNKIKYLNYIARVMEKYYKEDETFNLRLIVIYTGDVKSAEPIYETNCFTLRMEQAFLSHIDGETAFESISQKLLSGIPLEDDDLMKLVILPLTMPGIEGKQKMLEKVVDLAGQVTDSRQQIFILSGVIVASDKFINREYLEQIRRRINMTQLGQLYEKEKIEYANKKNRELTVENIIRYINDVAGVRIICTFTSDIYRIADAIAKQSDVTVLRVKDYIANPKPNGYTSYHMIVSIPIFLSNDKIDTKVEIQIRTIAMDFWASLEHKIYYKFDGKAPDGIREELKECANIISFLDQKMFSINEDVKHYHDDFNGGSFVTNDLPAHITKEKSDTIPPELKSLYGSVVSD